MLNQPVTDNYNLILDADSYKTSHFKQYPKNTEYVSSYIESRGGDYDDTVFFGLQHFLKKYLSTPITMADIDEAEDVLTAHGMPFNREDWEYILDKHDGYLPIEIEAVPEGSIVPTKNALVQVKNTDPKLPWLTSYVETTLLRAVWYPVTVATHSRECKKAIQEFVERTSDTKDVDAIADFMLQDFGARAATCYEQAAIGGAAHLVNFKGSDTLQGILMLRRYYNESMAGFSIPASEHSTMTSWGRNHEKEAYENMVDQFGGDGKMFAVVSDSYDLWNALDNIWGKDLKQKVKENGGRVVIRPDSGDPIDTCIKTVEKLMDKFGYDTNSKGYKVLPDYIRVIQGDGVSLKNIRTILEKLEAKGIAAENLAFGMGGELLQKVNRDTLKFAMKASAVCVDGKWRDVYKDPITDPGKRSKRGRLMTLFNGQSYETIPVKDYGKKKGQNMLETVFYNGKLQKEYSFADIRKRAAVPKQFNDAAAANDNKGDTPAMPRKKAPALKK